MTITHFPVSGYTALPWKNGLGTTDEICLRPEGATREAFGLRVSRATIAEPGRFSAFPGVERVITLIDGTALDLDFGERVQRLQPRTPYGFDSAQMPVGDPKGGAVRVLNVMAARSDWRIVQAEVLQTAANFAPALCVFFAISGDWTLCDGGTEVLLPVGDTALVEGRAELVPARGAQAAMLMVNLVPAGMPGPERRR